MISIIKHKPNRQQILIAGGVAAVSNMLIILSVSFMTNTSIAEGFNSAIWSAAGAVVASLALYRAGFDL